MGATELNIANHINFDACVADERGHAYKNQEIGQVNGWFHTLASEQERVRVLIERRRGECCGECAHGLSSAKDVAKRR